jgi:N-acetylglucosaminyldiphosphoundecaprenol N-acetyl-beta-D-mannosaminyltransferase
MSMHKHEAVPILGVAVTNASSDEAIALMERLIGLPGEMARSIFIVNAHTLNLAAEDDSYHDVLRGAFCVFADGTGARWAARLRGVKLKDNLVGTDLVPRLFRATTGRGYRYFLLGADPKTIEGAADYARQAFPGWELAGFYHGYTPVAEMLGVIERINAAKPDVLLVGMGNPKQEIWIHHYREQLRVPICIGVGGLFDHWGGNLKRAPLWVRQRGFEWLQLLLQQPHKWRRYLVGNPKFLFRIVRELRRDCILRSAAPPDQQGTF